MGGTLTPLQVGEDFLVEELPLIIRHAFLVEPEGVSLKLPLVLKLHLDDETLQPCKFHTNLRTKQAFQFDSFLRKAHREDLQIPWFAIWFVDSFEWLLDWIIGCSFDRSVDCSINWLFDCREFCEHHHVKECRTIIPRPPELPSMLEIADSFWFFSAANFSAVKYKFVSVIFSHVLPSISSIDRIFLHLNLVSFP